MSLNPLPAFRVRLPVSPISVEGPALKTIERNLLVLDKPWWSQCLSSFISFMNEPDLIGKDDCTTKTHTPHRTHAVALPWPPCQDCTRANLPCQGCSPAIFSKSNRCYTCSELLWLAAICYRQTSSNDMHLKLLNGTCNSNVFNSLSCLGSASDLHTVTLETQSMQPLDNAVCHDGQKVQASRWLQEFQPYANEFLIWKHLERCVLPPMWIEAACILPCEVGNQWERFCCYM